jgi:hypothetical protein
MAHEDVLDILLLEDLVIDRQDGTAGIAEDVLDTIVLQRAENDFRSRHPVVCRLIVRARHVSVPFDAGDLRFVAGSPDFGHKKRPLRSLRLAHGWLSPDGYTILPMRFPTTIRTFEIVMGGSDRQKISQRQRIPQ